MTHCDLLPLIAEKMPIELILDCDYIGFYKSIANSDNELLIYTSKCKLFNHSSTLGRNITHLIPKYGLQVDDMLFL